MKKLIAGLVLSCVTLITAAQTPNPAVKKEMQDKEKITKMGADSAVAAGVLTTQPDTLATTASPRSKRKAARKARRVKSTPVSNP